MVDQSQNMISQLSGTNGSSESHFLNLPVDILLVIHSFLPASSQLCLLTTCHGIKILLEHTGVSYSLLTLEQKREYKALVIRGFPDAWLDAETLRFREFQEQDLYPQPKGPPFIGQPGWDSVTARQFVQGALLIKHRHVQMSLKYDRLEKKTPKQKSFLNALLKPYHTYFSTHFGLHPLGKPGAVGRLESHPKLVSGRYLLFNQWTFKNPQRGGTIILHKFGNFGACTHQTMSHYDWGYFSLRRDWDAEWDILLGPWIPLPRFNEEFVMCVREAFENPGCQVDGMCPHCLTEFSICTTTKRMQMRVWRDLGTEASCWGPVWQTHLGKTDPQGLPMGDDCHEIRSRYGDTSVEGQ